MLDRYNGIVRVIAFATGLGMWAISIYFSAEGFNVKIPDMKWVGLLMGLFITVIELVFNRAGLRHNLTLILAGVFAYSYGLWTNFVGIMNAQQGVLGLNDTIILPALFAMLLEFVPEPFILYALLGENEEDPLSKLFGGAASLFSKGGSQPSVPTSPFRPGVPPFRPGGSPPTHLSFLTKPPRGEDKD